MGQEGILRDMVKRRIAYCELESCLQQIDPAKLAKRPTMRFCCRKHAVAWRQAHGDYHRIGELGNKAQAAYKAQTGHIPHYEKRRDAVARSNHEYPRRGRRNAEMPYHEYLVTVRHKDDLETLIKRLNGLWINWEPMESTTGKDEEGTYYDYSFSSRELTEEQEIELDRKEWVLVFCKDGEEYYHERYKRKRERKE